ncbi:DMT family transporter [Candidatus Proelusimicrobium volucris]|uniref:DMT family transporter n=1 Tax=Candidatus Proelusimicrobium volucris TaxID=3416225 RepID=UPI003D0C04BC
MNVFYFFLLAFFWGTAYVGVKYTVDVFDPYFSSFLRAFIGFVFFAGWFLLTKQSFYLPRKEAWRPWLAGMLIMGIPFIFLYWGQQFLPPGTGGIFNGTVPLWVFIIAALTLKGQDAFTWRKAIGVVVGFIGLMFVFQPALVAYTSASMDKMALYGSISLLLMAICYACGNVLIKYIMINKITWQQSVFHQYLFSMVFLFIVSLLAGPKLPSLEQVLSPKVIISVLYVALCSSAAALLLLMKLLKEWGALRASMATYLVPFIAVGSDFLMNGRIPDKYEVIGMIIIIVSLVLIQFDKTSLKQDQADKH